MTVCACARGELRMRHGAMYDARCTMHDVGECRKQHQKKKSSTGLEPAISRFVGGCLIHWATKTPQGHQHPQHTKSQSDDKHTNNTQHTRKLSNHSHTH